MTTETKTALEFMQRHADGAVAGKMAEIMGDLTQDAMSGLMPLMGSLPNPATGNKVVPVSQNGDDYIFDVTYTGDGGKAGTMRETVRQIDGVWKIVAIAAP